jgi:hypothetical protein
VSATSDYSLPASIIAAYPPSELGLFELIRDEVTDSMLQVIANCDNGANYVENLIELKLLREGKSFGRPMDGIPNEVLCLFRWSELGNGPNLDTDRNFHIARAFSCCCLLLVEDVVENRARFSVNSALPLAESCAALGPRYQTALCRQLVWMLGEMDVMDENFLFNGFVLLVALQRPQEQMAMGKWLMNANNSIMPKHCSDYEPNLKIFTDLRFVALHPVKLKRYAEKLMRRLDGEPALVDFLSQI